MSYLCGDDLKKIEALVFQPELEPSYEVIKDALIWSDERPEDLSSEGYEKLIDLWIARSLIHKGIPFSDWRLDPEYFEKVWSEATKQNFKWPGFNRLHLSNKDKAYYLSQQEQANEEFY
jgi:hypothetical protein